MKDIKTKESANTSLGINTGPNLSCRMRKGLRKSRITTVKQDDAEEDYTFAEVRDAQETGVSIADHFVDDVHSVSVVKVRRSQKMKRGSKTHDAAGSTASQGIFEAGRRSFIAKRSEEISRKKLSKTAEKSSSAVKRIVAGTSGSIKKAVTEAHLILAAGGILPVVIIVFICSIGLAVGSSFGVFYAGESSPAIVEVAKTQIGNIGGEPYWSWYGFSSRVEWCSCFVSWCADECGYIDAGLVPMHADPQVAVNWYKANDRWLPGNSEPVPGMLIFFDWDNKGLAGDQNGYADHIGIVEKVEDGWVCTIEGNTADSVARRRYMLGHYEIMGYGCLK